MGELGPEKHPPQLKTWVNFGKSRTIVINQQWFHNIWYNYIKLPTSRVTDKWTLKWPYKDSTGISIHLVL